MAFVLSQLQLDKYAKEFATQMDETNQGLGLSHWLHNLKQVRRLDSVLSSIAQLRLQMNLLISSAMTENKAILTEANHTVSSVMRTVKSQVSLAN